MWSQILQESVIDFLTWSSQGSRSKSEWTQRLLKLCSERREHPFCSIVPTRVRWKTAQIQEEEKQTPHLMEEAAVNCPFLSTIGTSKTFLEFWISARDTALYGQKWPRVVILTWASYNVRAKKSTVFYSPLNPWSIKKKKNETLPLLHQGNRVSGLL